jgi:hypothetical protein
MAPGEGEGRLELVNAGKTLKGVQLLLAGPIPEACAMGISATHSAFRVQSQKTLCMGAVQNISCAAIEN